jgi:preprotein translocase subunit SecF
VATFHDALAVLAVFFLLGKEINLILITALLTIAGYSLTDTVVVFDRIRENLRTRIKEPVEVVMNASINEVLSRTVVTSFTVLLTSLALFFFGGEVLHDFSLAMILGVIFGTYSTIFVASPIALFWERIGFFKKRK